MPNQPTNWSAFLTNWIAGTFTEEQTTSLDLQSLEDRVLYSAGPVPVDFVQPEIVETGMDMIELNESIDSQFDFVADAIESYDSADLEDTPSVTSDLNDLNPQLPSELVIVDTSVEGYQQLVDDILSNSSGRNIEVAYIESGSNGIQQITEAVAQRSNLSAIHLITHGDDGQLAIGDTLLTQDSLAQYSDEIAAWRTSLSDGADFLIYGCNVAESESGEAFVNELSDLLDADIAASNDVTGHDSLQGDWQFEYQVGQIDSNVVFSVEILENWNHSLEGVDASSADGAAGSIAVNGSTGQVINAYTFESSGQTDVFYVATSIEADPNTGQVVSIAQSDPILINTQTAGDTQTVNGTTINASNQSEVSVAAAANGNTVFVWTSDHDGQNGVYARVIDAQGEDIRSEFQVDLGGNANNASVAIDDAGNFVVAWQSGIGTDAGDVFVSYFDAEGNFIANTAVNSDFVDVDGNFHDGTTGLQGNADVSLNNNGEFVVAWDNFLSSEFASSVYVEKFQFDPTVNNIVSLSNDIVAAQDTSINRNADVDISERGEFVLVFTNDSTDAQRLIIPGETLNNLDAQLLIALDTGVSFRAYNSDNILVAEQDQITGPNTELLGPQELPTVAFLENNTSDPFDNEVYVAWQGDGQGVQGGTFFSVLSFDGQDVLSEGILGEASEHVALATFNHGQNVIAGYETVNADGVGVFEISPVEVVPTLPGPPTEISPGIQLNTNGGNDAYFLAEDTDFLDGLDEFTIEVTFSSDQVDRTVPLFSYQTPTDELLIQYNPDGTLSIHLPGGEVQQLNGYNYSQVFDGRLHQLTVGYESGNQWVVFVDGVERDTGSTSAPEGTALSSGGALVFGQEQDSPNGDFDPDAFFGGTIHDVRIWDFRLDGAHAETNLLLQVSQDSIPTGLIANWQFNALEADQSVVNVVDPSNSLELKTTGVIGDVAGNASQTLSVIENADSDTIIGTFSTTSPNNQETFTYRLINDAGGRFEIDANSGELTVRNGNFIDFENSQVHSVTVEATASHGSTTESLAIAVVDDVADNPDNLPPELRNNFVPTFVIANPGEPPIDNVITQDSLLFVDPDDFSNDEIIVYRLTAPLQSGILLLNGEEIGDDVPFSQQQINGGLVTYRFTGPEGTTATTDGFSFTVSDGTDTVAGTFEIFVGNTIPEEGSGVVGNQIRFPGIDEGVRFTLEAPPQNGELRLGGDVVLGTGDFFTKEQLDAGLVVFHHDGTETRDDNFRLNIEFEGTTNGTEPAENLIQLVDLNIRPVNDAPNIDLDQVDNVDTENDFSLSYNPNQEFVSVTGDVSITDIDNTEFQSLRIELFGFNQGAEEEIRVNGVTFQRTIPNSETTTLGSAEFLLNFNGQELRVTRNGGGGISTFELEQLAQSVEYRNLSTAPPEGDRILQFSVTDAGGATSDFTAQSTISIEAIPVPPVAMNDMVEIMEDQAPTNINLLGNDSNFPFGAVEVQIISGPDNGTLSPPNVDGSVNYQPNLDFNGPDEFTYRLLNIDTGLFSEEATVKITVTPENDAPTAQPDVFTTDEDTELTGNLLLNDSDIDGDTFTLISVNTTLGTVTDFNADGTFVYIPNLNISGVDDNFTYQLADSNGEIVQGSGTITINAVNDAPIIDAPFERITNEDEETTITELQLLQGISDIENDALSVSNLKIISGNGEFVPNGDGEWIYRPAANDNSNISGLVIFEYTVSHVDGGPDITATGTIDILPVNDAPTTSEVVLLPIDNNTGVRIITQADLLANASDADLAEGDVLEAIGLIIQNQNAGNATLSDNEDGTYTLELGSNNSTEIVFQYTITDNSTGSSGPRETFATARLDISAFNDAPVANDDSYTTDEDTFFSGSVLDNDQDAEGDELSVLLVARTNNGDLTFRDDGTFDYQPNQNFNGTDSFTYRTLDPSGELSDVATVTITVNSINDAPTTTFVSLADIIEDSGIRVITQAELLANANDVDNDELTVSEVVISEGLGTLVDNEDGTWSYTPTTNDGTDVTFTYTISDGTVSIEGSAELPITRVNDALDALDDTFETNEDVEVTGNVLTNDSDIEGDELLVNTEPLVEPNNGTLVLNPDGSFSYTPDEDFFGKDSFVYEVTDGNGEFSQATVTIEVKPVNDAPVAQDDAIVIDEGGSAIIDIAGNDFDVDADFIPSQITVDIVTGPTNGTAFIDINGQLNFEHDGSEVFTDSIVYQIIDSSGLVNTAIVTIDVQPVDDLTIVDNDDLGSIDFGEQLIVSPSAILDNDIDLDSEISADNIVIIGQPDIGTVEIVDGLLVFIPNEGAFGDTEFEYQIDVDGQRSEVATAFITVEKNSIVINEPAQTVEPAEPAEPAEPDEPSNEVEDQEQEENEAEMRGRIVNNGNDDDDQITPVATRSDSNDILDNEVLESINSLKTSANETVSQSQSSGTTYSYTSRLDEISLLNLSGTAVATAAKVSEYEATYLAGLVWNDLDSAKQSYLLNGLQIGVPTIVSSAASFLTVGYLAWIVRGGVLLTTFMSSVPAWSSFDILSVIDAAHGDESIEQMVDH